MRPLYENKKSLEKEREFAAVIQEAWNCTLVKLPIQYSLDYGCYRDKEFLGFVELKNRSVNKSTYPTYMISLSKFLKAKELSRSTGKGTSLCVSWKDEKGYVRLDTIAGYDINQGGRTDRNDWQDQEPIVFIDINNFRKI